MSGTCKCLLPSNIWFCGTSGTVEHVEIYNDQTIFQDRAHALVDTIGCSSVPAKNKTEEREIVNRNLSDLWEFDSTYSIPLVSSVQDAPSHRHHTFLYYQFQAYKMPQASDLKLSCTTSFKRSKCPKPLIWGYSKWPVSRYSKACFDHGQLLSFKLGQKPDAP